MKQWDTNHDFILFLAVKPISHAIKMHWTPIHDWHLVLRIENTIQDHQGLT